MKPKCEESLSNLAFNCNLRHYTEDREEHAELHSAAMKLYSEYVETTGIQPCTYC